MTCCSVCDVDIGGLAHSAEALRYRSVGYVGVHTAHRAHRELSSDRFHPTISQILEPLFLSFWMFKFNFLLFLIMGQIYSGIWETLPPLGTSRLKNAHVRFAGF